MKYVKVASHGLIKKGDKFLATKRALTDDHMPGYWDLAGGTIEFHEKAEDALIREIQEEVGLNVNVGKLLFCYDAPSGPDRHQFQLVYECEYVDGDVKLDPESHCEYKWVDMDQAKELTKIAFFDELCKYIENNKLLN
jgi:8-oxo-dGTP diphosphatase